MPDISMCLNHSCPLKEKCYRYKAEVNSLWQAYADFTYLNGCDYFMPIWEKKKKTTKQFGLRYFRTYIYSIKLNN